jgi:hypothetical protein
MSAKIPKFLMGGVNFTNNFGGKKTIITAVYGWAELGIKLAPIFVTVYGLSKPASPYLPLYCRLCHNSCSR